jgi:pilus assembly protein Flp/PilA
MSRNLFSDETAQGMAEYGLIVALVAIVTIGSIILIKYGMTDIFRKVGDTAADPNPS